MLHKVLLIIPLLTILSCAAMPPPPQGNLCVFNSVSLSSDCVAINPSMVKVDKNGKLTFLIQTLAPTSTIPASQMNNWITFDPVTWANIQVYINRLKALAQKYIGP